MKSLCLTIALVAVGLGASSAFAQVTDTGQSAIADFGSYSNVSVGGNTAMIIYNSMTGVQTINSTGHDGPIGAFRTGKNLVCSSKPVGAKKAYECTFKISDPKHGQIQ